MLSYSCIRVMMAHLAQLDHKDPLVHPERLAPLDQRDTLVIKDLRYCMCVVYAFVENFWNITGRIWPIWSSW